MRRGHSLYPIVAMVLAALSSFGLGAQTLRLPTPDMINVQVPPARNLFPDPIRREDAVRAAMKEIPPYSFLDSSANKIVGEGRNYEKVWAKLDSLLLLGEGNLRIMHIGGSHVQGGALTHELRRDFLTLCQGKAGDVGMAFPYTAAKTNTPLGYRTHYTGKWTSSKCLKSQPEFKLGLMGMAVAPEDTGATVSLVTRPRYPLPGEEPIPFDVVKVLGYTEGDTRPVVLHASDTLEGIREEFYHRFNLPCRTDSVNIGFRGDSGRFVITGLRLENGNPGVSVSGVGVNGASLVSYQRCENLRRDLELVRPDLVIFAIGINDAVSVDFNTELFKMRYESMISKVLEVNPDCAILFVSNNDSCRRVRRKGYVTNQNGPLASEAFADLAKMYHACHWDLFNIMGGLGSMRRWEAEKLARRDKVHFTESGYELIADMLFNALMRRYEEYISEGGNVFVN